MTTVPEFCGFYSVNANREYDDSISSLRYFIKPNLPLDLNAGIDKLRNKPEKYYHEQMEHILTFIVKHKSELMKKTAFSQNERKLIPGAQYITYRGVLKKIMCSRILPHPFTIIATKYKGNIYLCQYTSSEEIEKEMNADSETKRFSNYGPMFEHYCLSDQPNRAPDTTQVCDASPQFFCVFKRSLANRQFLFAGEMDAVESATPLDPGRPNDWKLNEFIELKLNCELNTPKRKSIFQIRKVQNTWAQSYLTGVQRVYFGFRDESGIVKEMRCYSIDELEKISRKYWKDPTDGFALLDTFEIDLKDIDCPYTTIIYHIDMKSGLSSTLHKGKTEYSFLPEWYLQQMNM